MAEKPHVISLGECAKLDKGQVDELVKSIRKMPGKSLALSRAEYRVLSNFQKSLFLHKGGGIQRPSMTRADFDQLNAREKANFINTQGGKLR